MFIFTILMSFRAVTGSSHMDEHLLSIYIVDFADVDLKSLQIGQLGHFSRDIHVFDIF